MLKTNNLETHIGKVRVISELEVRVSLFQKGKEWVIGNLPRSYFPEVLKPGQVFRYYPIRQQVKMMEERELSGKELKQIYDEVVAELPHDEPL